MNTKGKFGSGSVVIKSCPHGPSVHLALGLRGAAHLAVWTVHATLAYWLIAHVRANNGVVIEPRPVYGAWAGEALNAVAAPGRFGPRRRGPRASAARSGRCPWSRRPGRACLERSPGPIPRGLPGLLGPQPWPRSARGHAGAWVQRTRLRNCATPGPLAGKVKSAGYLASSACVVARRCCRPNRPSWCSLQIRRTVHGWDRGN